MSPCAVILEPKKIKSVTFSIFSPSICHEEMGPEAIILVFWMLIFNPAFHSPFTLSKRLFSSSLLFAIRVVVSPAYLRLLIFLPAVLIPACALSSPAFHKTYSAYRVSLMAQLLKNLPAVWKTWVWSLGWEEPLEEDMATHSSILAWRIPMDRGAWWATVHGGPKESDATNHWATGGSSIKLVTFLQTWRLHVLCLIGP